MNFDSKAKRFGAFAGVFTPSVLTILGVIMYMRLGWVVGHAGLFNTLIIILLAHIISFSTGLSVSSIATDKKIRAGGIYYILSRSLGLPIGGAIGIALVVGTALSISLYLIGFAESFISIPYLQEFFGLEPSINSYRLIGTTAILVLVIIAYISTSLAIKTQFYILAAIILSLVSIVVGVVSQIEHQAAETLLFAPTEGLPMEILFAVFFPAVTGFTAGIAMSGDLKEPGKAIPRGTLAAISVGFIIYIGLAIVFAFYVNPDLLINDTNFLLKVSWIAPLVIAGIWGATLSSALGGILGGPRITQAMATDKIGPRFLAKGFGINNEPRTALLFVFIIAQAGILIGDLNVIARVVTMFYLASYGFINLAFYLESLSSVDFRPSFKVNKYVGLVGFLAAFGVMFKLDFMAMIVALIVMAALYLFLKKRQLRLEYGDVWQSVWLTLTRIALRKLETSKTDERNWLPNIILFSGGTTQRPHLIELGKSLVGKQGVLSNFDLIEQPDSDELFPKSPQAKTDEMQEAGIFHRRQAVKNIYTGIEMIARTYGFSGIEPNTIMMGWVKHTKDPDGFARLIQTFKSLDLNNIIIRYDSNSGFGTYKTIDCWIANASHHSGFALTITRLLQLSEKWRSAQLRILVVNEQNEYKDEIRRTVEDSLEQMRLQAKVKVINNQLEKKPYYTIVEEESDETDLVIFELPEINDQSSKSFIESNNKLLEKIGTTIMVCASTDFGKLELIQNKKIVGVSKTVSSTDSKIDHTVINIDHINNELVAEQIKRLWGNIQSEFQQVFEDTIAPLYQYRIEKARSIRQLIDKTLHTLESKLPQTKSPQKLLFVHQLKTGIINKIIGMTEELLSSMGRDRTDYLQASIVQLLTLKDKALVNLEDKISTEVSMVELIKDKNSEFGMKFFRLRKRALHLFSSRRSFVYQIKFKQLAQSTLSDGLNQVALESVQSFERWQTKLNFEYRKLIYSVNDAFAYLENHVHEDHLTDLIRTFYQTIEEQLLEVEKLTANQPKYHKSILLQNLNKILNELGREASSLHPNHFINRKKRKSEKRRNQYLLNTPMRWSTREEILLNTLKTEASLMLLESRLVRLVEDSVSEIKTVLISPILVQINKLNLFLTEIAEGKSEKEFRQKVLPKDLFIFQERILENELNRILEKTLINSKNIQKDIPEKILIFNESTLNQIIKGQLEYEETMVLNVSKLIDGHIQRQLMDIYFDEATALYRAVLKQASIITDSARLLSVNLESQSSGNEPDEYDSEQGKQELVREQQIVIQRQHEEIENTALQFSKNISLRIKQLQVLFTIYGLARSALKYDASVSGKLKHGHFNMLKNLHKDTMDFLARQQARFWHSHSDALMISDRLAASDNSIQSPLSKLIQLKEQLSPSPEILTKLPFYYRQLFTGQFVAQSALWVGRDEQLNQARQAINRHKSGMKGFITITAGPAAGKSFFVHHMASRLLFNRKVFFVNSPRGGSVDEQVFNQALCQATSYSGTTKQILAALPENSVVIIDGLELWWERSLLGLRFIENLYDVFTEFCSKILFVFTCRTLTYNIICQQISLNDFTIQQIDLPPMNSRDLQKSILLRHRTTGYDLQIDRRSSARLTITREARLFSSLFKQSDGVIGSALLLWVASIEAVKDKIVVVASPKTPDLYALESLDNDLKQMLLQLLLHKQVSLEKLRRITLLNDAELQQQIGILKRAGILIDTTGSVMEIQPYFQHQVNMVLKREIIRRTEN